MKDKTVTFTLARHTNEEANISYKSIDTAPKDGRDFIALQGSKNPCVMYYSEFHKNFVRTVTCRRCSEMGLGSLTHWAELPKLPVDAA